MYSLMESSFPRQDCREESCNRTVSKPGFANINSGQLNGCVLAKPPVTEERRQRMVTENGGRLMATEKYGYQFRAYSTTLSRNMSECPAVVFGELLKRFHALFAK